MELNLSNIKKACDDYETQEQALRYEFYHDLMGQITSSDQCDELWNNKDLKFFLKLFWSSLSEMKETIKELNGK